MKKLAVLSGAGISAESGLKTFRDSNGLWEGHDVMEVASPQGWYAKPRAGSGILQSKKKTGTDSATQFSTHCFGRIGRAFQRGHHHSKCRQPP